MKKAGLRFAFLLHLIHVASAFAPVSLPAAQKQRASRLWGTTAASKPANRPSNDKFSDFDYLAHWYPASWLCDLRVGEPISVSLFDIDYVLAVHDDQSIVALVDQCPHKAAKLSEGRLTSTGLVQCAYHGWSFDGSTGECMQIPQAAASAQVNSPRNAATSIPTKLHQGMVWLWPGEPRDTYPSPPTVPEMDDPEFRVTTVVRDFPNVDWTLLVSNIMDPDHGVFAHQAPPFDKYSASPEFPMKIVEESFDDHGWFLKTEVPAVEKLLRDDKRKRGVKQDDGAAAPTVLATTIFQAPTTISLSRRDPKDDTTKFVTAFWVCPSGTGRSRFFSTSVGKFPKWIPNVPRWVMHATLNSFLDQDTVLVASQQPPILAAELQGKGRSSGVFAYGSPTDKSVRRIDQFWDSTVWHAPNRSGANLKAAAARLLPSRRVILDREVQHLDICPDSQDTVRNCRRLRNASLAVVASVLGFGRQRLLPKRWWIATALTASILAWGSEMIRRMFYFSYPESRRNQDLKGIPAKMWVDPPNNSV